MQKSNFTCLSVVNESKNTNYKIRSIFAIPQTVYSEEMEKPRDKHLYIKVQKLLKNSQKFKEELLRLAKRKEEMIQSTQSLLSETKAVQSNCEQRKIVLQEVIRVTQIIAKM